MDTIFHEFGEAQTSGSGYQLAATLSPDLSTDMLRVIWKSCNAEDAKKFLQRGIEKSTGGQLPHNQVQGWVEVYHHYWKAIGELYSIMDPGAMSRSSPPSWTRLYEAWKEMLTLLVRGYTNNGFEVWTIPCLYVTCKHLRIFAIKADIERIADDNGTSNALGANFQDDFDPESEKNQQLEDCARQLNRVFTLCLSDRAPLEDSRKWGTYYIANLLFKTYFKLNSANLCKNLLKVLSAGRADMPSLSSFPKGQQVTFKYYEGVLQFLEENYVEAEKHLTEAWNLCNVNARRNQELILTYLIPCHLLTTHTLPTQKLLEPFPRLQNLFLPLCQAIKKGDLHRFDLELQEGEDEFVKRRIYLTLERGRDIAMRNLLRKVFIAGGFEETQDPNQEPVRRTRVPIAEFAAAISLGSQETLETDEIECYVANMIYKNLMKGYIAHERGIVVLSKKSDAFPGTGV